MGVNAKNKIKSLELIGYSKKIKTGWNLNFLC